MLDTVVADPSPRVRAVVPGVYGQGNDGGWVHYFTETESIGHLGYYFQSSSRQRRLAPEAEAALQRLTADKEPTVSVEAFFCLIAHTVPVDLNRMTTVLDAIPDVGVIGERLAQLLEQQHGRLGAEFRVLVPYALRAARQDSYYARELRKKYGEVAEDDQFFSMRVLDRPAVSNAPLMATYRTGDTTDEAITNRPLRLLYFSQYGCKDCAKAERLLSDMTSYFGRLEVTKLDIRAHDAMLLNETLCERFGIDERSRLVAPAMFTAAGGLVRDDITFDRLTGLLARAAREPATDWYALTTEAQQQADTAIMGRGRGMGYGVACLAGLLDGVNPCAFATIIFLLSYLHIARRTPRQILQVGLAFILGVFIAYFSLGLGLGELVKKLGVVGRVATVVNGVLAAFVFIVAVLNVRDGILCLRGRMAEMTLQLPGALKAQIHGVVRRGARHHRFVIAAFLIGLAISVLELACTGQVYLPTIVYMLNRAETRWDGLGLLLAYNAAFILPLFVVFGLAALGLTHARLTTFMERHAALVKFATAALFFILFAVFIRTLV